MDFNIPSIPCLAGLDGFLDWLVTHVAHGGAWEKSLPWMKTGECLDGDEVHRGGHSRVGESPGTTRITSWSHTPGLTNVWIKLTEDVLPLEKTDPLTLESGVVWPNQKDPAVLEQELP